MKLRELRIEKGMRQTELAEMLNISVRTYQRIEYGQQLPNVQVAIRLQKIFRKEIDEIIKKV
ncbi:MAG: helix-turn-helix transcriptional regulator [Lachnospiraceae bacterium]